jgi:hypothetical protein
MSSASQFTEAGPFNETCMSNFYTKRAGIGITIRNYNFWYSNEG